MIFDRRAISIRDVSVACYWAKTESHTQIGAYLVPPGIIVVVEIPSEQWDSLTEQEFAESWVDEADCERSSKALQTLANLPGTYDDYVALLESNRPEVRQ